MYEILWLEEAGLWYRQGTLIFSDRISVCGLSHWNETKHNTSLLTLRSCPVRACTFSFLILATPRWKVWAIFAFSLLGVHHLSAQLTAASVALLPGYWSLIFLLIVWPFPRTHCALFHSPLNVGVAQNSHLALNSFSRHSCWATSLGSRLQLPLTQKWFPNL